MALDLRITLVSGFLIYFVGGGTLSRLDYDKRITVFMIALGVICAVGEIIFVIFNIKYEVNSYFTPFSIGISFSLYWLLSRFSENFCQKHKKILQILSDKTLTIYMGHDFGIVIIKKVFSLKEYGILSALAISFGSFVLCFAVSYILSLNKVTKKLFVGK